MKTMASEQITMPGIMDRLRSETRPNHDAAEQNGFGVLVMGEGLTMPLYVEHLVAWRRILAHLEHALRTSQDEIVAGTWHEGLAKEPVLDQDIDDLAPGGVGFSTSTTAAVKAFTDFVDELARENPPSLLGALYVLEGSTMGGSVMRPRIAEQLDLAEDHGLRYYGVYGKQVGVRFKEFRARMGASVDGTGVEDAVVAAAKMTFDRVGDILRAIAGS